MDNMEHTIDHAGGVLVIPKPTVTIDLSYIGPITFANVEGDIRMIKDNGTILPYHFEEDTAFYFTKGE